MIPGPEELSVLQHNANKKSHINHLRKCRIPENIIALVSATITDSGHLTEADAIYIVASWNVGTCRYIENFIGQTVRQYLTPERQTYYDQQRTIEDWYITTWKPGLKYPSI